MSIRFSLALGLIFCAAAFSAGATVIDSTPGRLGELIAQNPPADKTLQLTGSIDIRDFEALRELGDISTLDLSGVAISEYSSTTPIFPGLTFSPAHQLPPYALFGSGVKRLILPATLRAIGDGALASTSITILTIPEGVESIGDYALFECRLLESVQLPKALQSIGRYSLAGCHMLRSLNIENTGIRHLPDHALADTPELKTLDTTEILSVGSEALSGSGISTIMLPKARRLDRFALYGTTALRTVTLNPDVRMSEGILMNASALREVRGIPDIIPDLFAANATTYSPLPATMAATSIGRYAFANCAADIFVLGRDITSIADNAFAGCYTLSRIDATRLGGFTPDVELSAFTGINTHDVYLRVKETTEDIWRAHPVWGAFNIITSEFPPVSDRVDTLPDDASLLSITFDGDNLVACMPDATTIHLSIYDTDGRLILTESSGSGAITIPLSRLPDGVLLISATSGSQSRRIKYLH